MRRFKFGKDLIYLAIIVGLAGVIFVQKYQAQLYKRFFGVFYQDNTLSAALGPNEAHRVELFETLEPDAEVVFIGDSITQAGEWSEFFPDVRTANRGIAGDRSADILARIGSIQSTKARDAFLMLGINDITHAVELQDILANYTQIIAALKDQGMRVVVQSTIQCHPSRCSRGQIKRVNQLNAQLPELTKRLGVGFLNLDDLSDPSGLDAKYTYDGIHLNAVGYGYWVVQIKSQL